MNVDRFGHHFDKNIEFLHTSQLQCTHCHAWRYDRYDRTFTYQEGAYQFFHNMSCQDIQILNVLSK